MDEHSTTSTGSYTKLELAQYALFWSWNLIFLAFMSFGFAPIILPQIYSAVRIGIIPASFLLFGLVLVSVPIAAVILGLTVLRRSPGRLFALGYVVEGPLMLMLAVRFFAIRQATTGTIVLMAIALLGMAAYLWYLLDSRAGNRRAWVEWVRLGGLTMMMLVSLYAAAWIAFYAIPAIVEAVRGLVDVLANLPLILSDLFRTLGDLLRETPLVLPFSILGFILLLYTATLFVLTPIAVPYLSVRNWWKMLRQRVGEAGRLRPAIFVAAILAACAGLFYLANQQPQAQAFALLEEPPASIDEAQSLLQQSETIRTGLLNAYLAPFRYISAQGEVRHISDIYASTFNISTIQANAVQRMYEGLASPLLYKPVHRPELSNLVDNHALVEEPRQAAGLYQNFFDTPITDGERQAIVKSVRTTWSADQAEAAWQAVDDREVYLVRQELTVQEHGDWADLELHEAYQNQTGDRQEVIYYFNLPESAVLTGLWLGNSPDKAAAATFQVAPRGAAQAIYREQTRVLQDPALLEQIGPRQYRLRVFPIPAMQINYDARWSRTVVEDAAPVYLWLAWKEMAAGEAWPLPGMAYLRNVYWDESTERLANGQPMEVDPQAWLPASLPAVNPGTPQSHRIDLPGGQSVLAIPAGQAAAPPVLQGLRLAVVLDRSYSMLPHAGQIASSLQEIEALEGLAEPVDVYLTASPYRGEEPSVASLSEISEQPQVYFGGQNAAQLLAQFESLRQAERADRVYDAVIVLTDGSGYELGAADIPALQASSPIWLVHVGGEIPLGYDDQTLEAIQSSGGGVAASLAEALTRIAYGLSAAAEVTQETSHPDLVDGYIWSVLPTEQASVAGADLLHTADDPITALAARRLVLAEMQRKHGTISELDTLDALHALAMRYQVVTPYSSMIVLVNNDQQALLDRLAENDDRYSREVEALSETTPGSPLPLAGVPEPHEWLLLGLGVALLAYLLYTKRIRFVRV